jgi:hypothetical protein
MTQFNEKLRGALEEANENSIAEVRALVAQSFTGRAKWITIAGWAKTLVFLGIAILAAVQFFKTDAIRAMIAWATLFVVATSSMGIMIVMYWMQLNRNAVTREVKRLELAIMEASRLARSA